jgi:hypothetical protein
MPRALYVACRAGKTGASRPAARFRSPVRWKIGPLTIAAWLRADNEISKLVFTILSAVAEAERDRIAERVATVKADQRQRGRYLGGKMPFSHHIGDHGELVDVPEEQAAITRMKSLRASGTSLRAIATEMKATGHDLSHEAVRGILERATTRRGSWRPGRAAGGSLAAAIPIDMGVN